MTTFEGILYGIIHGLTEFLPIGAGTHHHVIPLFLNVSEPSDALLAAMNAGAALALLIYLRHDFASMFASVLGIIAFRRPPMTIDERIPLFMLVSTIPVVGVWFYSHEAIYARFSDTTWNLGSFIAMGVLLFFADHFGRKSKGTYDWNWLDSALVGLSQILFLIPGAGAVTGVICGGMLRNYRREAVVKYALFCALPLLMGATIRGFRHIEFHGGAPALNTSWLTLSLAAILSFLTSLLAMSALLKQSAKKTMIPYAVYRIVAGVGALVWFLLR